MNYKPNQMTLTFQDTDNAMFQLAGSGTMAINWGDGSAAETHHLTSSEQAYWHLYPNVCTFSVTIIGDNITKLCCHDLQLICLDVSDNPALMELECLNGKTTSVDYSKNTALECLLCIYNQLTELDVSQNIALKDFGCVDNELTRLDVSHNTSLTCLHCACNALTYLDISANTSLTELDCSRNFLTSLDVGKNVELTKLYCNKNKLSADALNGLFATLPVVEEGKIDISDNPGTDDCNTKIAENKGWRFVKQMFLTVQGSGEVNIQLAGTEMMCINWNDDSTVTMETLSYDYSEYTHTYTDDSIHTIIITGENITALYCGNNRITELNVSKNSELTELGCYENQLTRLDVSQNRALTKLYCWSNFLTNLDVSANTELTELDCRNNRLTELDVNANSNLEILNCDNNQSKDPDLSANSNLIAVNCKQINPFQQTSFIKVKA